jgi:hypothetical protein
MKQYEVYFTIYGKHLKTTVMAYSEEDAYRQVRERLIIHKDRTKVSDPLEDLKNIFGFK